MAAPSEMLALQAFRDAARSVPAYRELLAEAGVETQRIETPADFSRVPVLDKHNTFKRFPIEMLCRDGELGQLGSVLTSSGHSGVFAFGLNEVASQAAATAWLDDVLDGLFAVRKRKSLLINCLPMGVKVSTSACTVAETSVRHDMAIALVKAFHTHFDQFVIIGDPGFLKHLLEQGEEAGVEWKRLVVHVVVGEEILPENARSYFGNLLCIDRLRPDSGRIISSMGIGEVGLHLFYEGPTAAPLVPLRELLHRNADLREKVLGRCESVPSLFTYDPGRIFVEFDPQEKLTLTTVLPRTRVPLIRYQPGDVGFHVRLPLASRPEIEAAGISWDALQTCPIVAIRGRGTSGVSPESVKEGIYLDASLARQTTANFRIVPREGGARIRIQLAPGVVPTNAIAEGFGRAISRYVTSPCEVTCEPYEQFGSGMTLDFERKFNYLGA